MDPTKIRNWALALTAVGAVLGGSWAAGKSVVSTTRDLIAQEASTAARAQMEPATKELEQIKDLLRRQEDRDAFRACMDYQFQDDPREVRLQKCEQESNLRWARWQWEDCEVLTPGQCGAKP